jgi:hypothetical protein
LSTGMVCLCTMKERVFGGSLLVGRTSLNHIQSDLASGRTA